MLLIPTKIDRWKKLVHQLEQCKRGFSAAIFKSGSVKMEVGKSDF